MRTGYLLLAAVLLSTWPVWVWYSSRLMDGGDERWALASLLSVTLLVFYRASSKKTSLNFASHMPAMTALLFFYVLSYWFAPALVQAFLAVTILAILASSLLYRMRLHPGIWLLSLLALPIIPTLDFYLSYPLRSFVASLAVPLLNISGYAVSAQGIVFYLGERTIAIDAPCSGIYILWSSFFLAAMLLCLRSLNWKKSTLLMVFSLVAAIFTNVIRAACLLVANVSVMQFTQFREIPALLHYGIGAAAFCFCGVAIILFASFLERLDKDSGSSNNSSRTGPVGRPPLQSGQPRLLLGLCLIAALIPFIPVSNAKESLSCEFPGWPVEYMGHRLKPSMLSNTESRFAAAFPGRFARFTFDGRSLLMRWIEKPTRQLHPAIHCYKASGYAIKPLAIKLDQAGNSWSRFEARKGATRLVVSERLYDNDGNSWSDVSQWYWNSLLGHTTGPWWAVTVAESR